MECNKDEAIRAKEIAEKKFADKEIAEAKKFAVRAQNIFPGLEGIEQMISTLDVYISAENKMNGEADWYGILNVKPQADDETVRKHYRKLALTLHPDKNKSIGAEGAFKYISEAWSMLSDKGRRGVYDQKRNGCPSASTGTYGFQNFSKTTTVKTQKKSTRMGPISGPAPNPKHKLNNTFWTVCNRCKMQYEYLRVYLNHNLLCPHCHEPFMALETPPPPMNFTKSATSWISSQQQEKGTPNPGKNNGQLPPFSGSTGASTAAQAATMVQQTYQKVKREREVAQSATKKDEALRRRKYSKRNSVTSSLYNGRDNSTPTGIGTGVSSVSGNNMAHENGDILQVRIQNILMSKAKVDIQNRLNEWNSANTSKESDDGISKGITIKKDEPAQPFVNGSEHDQNRSGGSLDTKTDKIRSEPFDSGCNTDSETIKTISISVPDSDFHDFDKDRTELSFGDNQVWAAYDDDDGMPRYYALIHNVISKSPFTMRISWLNSKTNNELGSLNWVGSGFAKTCGEFRVGRYKTSMSLNSFSHKVLWVKGARGAICIFPRKGEVWALYRNWSPNWNELTSDEVIHKYEMVEVVEGFDEAIGVIIIPLVKVTGFKTVFHRHLDLQEVRRIPREEMFRFSHQLPSYSLTGQEALNAPKGCLELDPAATPFELLQVIEEVKDEDVVQMPTADDTKIQEDGVAKTSDTVKVTVNVMEENRKETEVKVISGTTDYAKIQEDDAEKTSDTAIVTVMEEKRKETEEKEIPGTSKTNPGVETKNEANLSNVQVGL